MTKIKSVTEGASLRNAFGQALADLAPDHDFRVFDADVQGGTGVHLFRERYPDRFRQCGIAEQGMVAAAAGYAKATGKTVFATTFAVFGMRAWEVFRLSVAHDKVPVILALSHLGLDVGPDGASAQSLEHYACWRSIPGVTVIHPCDGLEMLQVVRWLLENPRPAVLLTGRSETPEVLWPDYEFKYGIAQPVWTSVGHDADLHLVASGMMVARAVAAAERLDGYKVAVWNVSTIKPFDLRASELWAKAPSVLVCEDHSIYGGLYGAVCEAVCRFGGTRVGSVSTHDTWGQSGEAPELAQAYGLDAATIERAAREMLR